MSNKKIYRAGMMPYYTKDNTIYMLFMKPSDPNYGGFFFFYSAQKVK